MARDLSLRVNLKALDNATKPLRTIAGGAVGLGRALKDTRGELKGLQALQKDVTSFRNLKGASEQTGAAMQANRERVKALSREMANTATPTKALTREFQGAVRQGHNLKQTHAQQQRELQGLRSKLGEAGISTRSLTQHERELRQRVEGTNKTLAQQEQRLKQLTTQQKRLGQAKAQYERTQQLAGSMAGAGAGGLAAGSGILYAGAKMLAPAVASEQQGSLIAAQSGEGADRAGQYTNIIKGIRADGLGGDVAAVGAAVAAVSSTLGALGKVSDRELDRASRKALDMSAVLGGDVVEHIQTAAIMMKNGLAGSSDEAFDLITRGMQGVSTQMRGELPEILHEYSTHFRGLGFDGKEAMSLLVDMAAQGKFALDKTGDALKEFSIRGSDMSKASVAAYEMVGLNAEKMSSAIAQGGDGARQALEQTAKGLMKIKSPAERANAAIALFGTPVEDLAIDQIPAFLQALSGSTDNLGKVEGAADQLGTTLRDNLGGDLDKLSGSWGALVSSMFNDQGSMLRDVTQTLTGIIGGVKGWVAENPKLASNLVKTAAGVAILMAGMGGLTLAIASILGPFAMVRYGMMLFGIRGAGLAGTLFNLGKTALPLVGKGILFIGRALMMNPIGLAITAIAAGAYLIYRNWEPIKAFFLGIWSEIRAGIGGGLAGIGQLIVNFSPLGLFYRAFAGVMSYFGVDLPSKFSEFGGNMIQGLINGFTGMFPNLTAAISGAATSVVSTFKGLLGIHSPSRVFAGLGGDTMAGLEQGLAGGESGPLSQLAGTAKRLTAAGAVGLSMAAGAMPAAAAQVAFDTRAPLAAAASSGGAGGITIQGDTITIIVQAGQGQDVAQQIKRALEDHERGKLTRARSALYDQD
ncbi:phage tail tape measure protein [Stutzerimonas stutzeri]|uniref:phage tail tape measure protein n=1 Tax=Stutzerimonas stutzeri TaxID=316 RepID=UPI00210BEAA4|nr:phage tail tape measure protein [Stutzerimonas stutzeri]MCQ4242488.1 phage tail tape measure protein [Stutzerimonas stutzeri]